MRIFRCNVAVLLSNQKFAELLLHVVNVVNNRRPVKYKQFSDVINKSKINGASQVAENR